jgi:hypothetical protein
LVSAGSSSFIAARRPVHLFNLLRSDLEDNPAETTPMNEAPALKTCFWRFPYQRAQCTPLPGAALALALATDRQPLRSLQPDGAVPSSCNAKERSWSDGDTMFTSGCRGPHSGDFG